MMKWSRFAAVAILLMIVTEPTYGQTITAFKTGERTTGMTKQCYYEALGSEYTKTVSSATICPISISVRAPASPSRPQVPEQPRPRTITAYKTGERTSGMTKQCFYNGMGSQYTRTYSSTAICPITIQVVQGG